MSHQEDLDPLLDKGWPLPIDRPFTTRDAAARGVSGHVLKRLVRQGVLRRPFNGVYLPASLVDDISSRAAALALVTPRTAVVTDRSAAWVHEVDVLAPGDHLSVPPVSVYQIPGNTRVRRAHTKGGERTFRPGDVMVVNGVLVTTPLRTALDLGRLIPRDHAIGALDGLLRLGEFTHEDLLAQVERFARQRGVVQLRELAPLADARSESPAESVLRLRWVDSPSLPRPEPQIVITDAMGNEVFRLDLGIRELRYAAEYDGVQDHTSPEDRDHDKGRRAWLREKDGWTLDVLTRKDVFGPHQCAAEIIGRGIAEAREKKARGVQKATGRRWPRLRR